MSANFATFQERCSLRLISSYEMNHIPFLSLVLKSIQTMFTLVMVMGHTGIKRKYTGTFCYSDDAEDSECQNCILTFLTSFWFLALHAKAGNFWSYREVVHHLMLDTPCHGKEQCGHLHNFLTGILFHSMYFYKFWKFWISQRQM